jgi:hypothetical protein
MTRTFLVLRPAARRPLFFLTLCLLGLAVLTATASPPPGDPIRPIGRSIENREPMDESDELGQGSSKREPMDESDELGQGSSKREPMDESDELVGGAFACAPRVRLEGRAGAILQPLRLVAVTLASDGWLAFAQSGVPAGDAGAPARLLDAWGRPIAELVEREPVRLTASTYYLELATSAAGETIELVAELE